MYKQIFNKRHLYLLFLLFMACLSCDKKASVESTKEMVFMVNLVNDEQKVKEYLDYHQKIWPEVEAGFRKAGYKKIDIYRFNTSLVMIVTIPKNADLNQMGKIAEAYDRKCTEWNRLMNEYQVGVQGTSEDQKWVSAALIYSFDND